MLGLVGVSGFFLSGLVDGRDGVVDGRPGGAVSGLTAGLVGATAGAASFINCLYLFAKFIYVNYLCKRKLSGFVV